MIYAKRTMGSEIIWMHLIVLLGDVDQAEGHFDLFGDSVNLGAR
jgi:hypothetical protein